MNKYQLIVKKSFNNYEAIDCKTPYKIKNKKDFIGTISFYHNDLVYKIIKKKTDQSFKKLLEVIIKLDEDDNPGEGYILCLNEIDKFRQELINKYEKYLKREQMNFLKKKINLIEKDLQNKLLVTRINLMEKEMVDENIVSHHR